METLWNPPYFLSRWSYLILLPLLLTTMSHSVTENAAPIELSVEVGGSLAIHCPTKHKNIDFFYFQKGAEFVNGCHKLNFPTQTWKNTRMDPHNNTTVHMDNLNVSHSGDYECHILYGGDLTKTIIHIHVTANYSKPEVKKDCSSGSSCLVKCVSHGGYPAMKMTWNVPGSRSWEDRDSSRGPDPDTLLFNSSSSANFNCSNGELRFVSCSVGDATSDMFSVCTPEDPPDLNRVYKIAGIVSAVVVVLVALALVLCIHKRRRRSAAAERQVVPEVNGSRTPESKEENVPLTDKKEEKNGP